MIDKLVIPYLSGIATAFEDSTTYLDFLAQINAKLNSVVDTINNIRDDWDVLTDEKIQAYSQQVNAQLESLRVYTNKQNGLLKEELVEYVDNSVLYYQSQIDTLFINYEYLNNQIVATNNSIVQMRNYLVGYVNQQNLIQDYENNVKFQEVYDTIEDLSKDYPPVYNPTTGHREPIDKVLNDMYEVLRYNGITALEFDLKQITAGEFDALQITAREFDLSAKTTIKYVDENLMMYNPFTGIKDLIKNVLTMAINRMGTGQFTAGEFDSRNITAGDFDSYNITAYNFDFNGANVIL